MKKVVAIILVLAMVLSFAGCGQKEPVETPAPTVAPQTVAPTNAPETQAPTVEPTVAPTEAPATEKPDKDGWITLGKPSGSTSGEDKKDVIINSAEEVAGMQTGTNYTFVSGIDWSNELENTAYQGTITISDIDASEKDIKLNFPNATIIFNDMTANTLSVVSGPHTAIFKGEITLGTSEKVKINGGNVTVEKTATITEVEINSDNTTDVNVASSTNVTVTKASAQGAIVTISGDAKSTIVNKADGTKVVAKEDSVATIDTTDDDTKATYIKNETTDKGDVFVKTDNETSGSVGDVADGLVSADGTVADKGVIEVSNKEQLIDALAKSGNVKLTADFDFNVSNVDGNSNPAINITADWATIDGNGKTITAVGVVTSAGSFINITGANNVEIKNLTIVGGNITDLKHGINVYESLNTTVDNVTINNFKATGMTVNGSKVTANDLTIDGAGWGGVNVSLGESVTAECAFTLTGDSTITPDEGKPQIYADPKTADYMAKITVNAEGYSEFIVSDTCKCWSLTVPTEGVKADDKYFASLALAVADGGEVTLLSDITFGGDNSGVSILKDTTIDLNGNTITVVRESSQPTNSSNVKNIFVADGATLTIKDSAQGGEILSTGGAAASGRGDIDAQGNVVVKGGKVGRILAIDSAKVTVDGGEVAEISNHNKMDGHTVITVNGGTVGSIYSTYMVKAYDHDVIINGGYVGSVVMKTSYWAYCNGANGLASGATPIRPTLKVVGEENVGAIALEVYENYSELELHVLFDLQLYNDAQVNCNNNTYTWNGSKLENDETRS